MIQQQPTSVSSSAKMSETPSNSIPKTPTQTPADQLTDLLCFSHLRWNFVYQRPQHLVSRASQQWRSWFIEEPIWEAENWTETRKINDNLTVVVPHIKHGTPHEDVLEIQRQMLDKIVADNKIANFVSWYYTPMALLFTDRLKPQITIYDCMDELSAFLGAPANLLEQEKNLLKKADIVFTGGLSLFEAKQKRHPNVFAFPSSIDYTHYEPARHNLPEPADMQGIARPRIGFCGVIDERMNIELLRELAESSPEWQFVLLGPVVKIDPASLPKFSNIHYLGFKSYDDLPAYFSNLDVAIMPFAINEATRYISPTKTPEYMAAGLPVVSTPIHDVVSTYEGWSPVQIAEDAAGFRKAIGNILDQPRNEEEWAAADEYLKTHSWDTTWAAMNKLIHAQLSTVFE